MKDIFKELWDLEQVVEKSQVKEEKKKELLETISGLREYAQQKNQECEVWARVCGFFRPTSCYNNGKKAEFEDRKMYKVTD